MGVEMPYFALTQTQIDLVTEACETAVNEHARFLDDDVRSALAQALRAVGKPCAAESIDPQ